MQKTIRTLALCAAVMCVATATRAQDTDVDVNNPQPPPPGPQTFVYSPAYERRTTIHRYASLATLPLFATELALGQSIYNDPNARDQRRSRRAHRRRLGNHGPVRRQLRDRRLEHVGEPI